MLVLYKHIVQFLVSAGAEVNIQDWVRTSSSTMLVLYKHIVQFLVAAGAEVNIQDWVRTSSSTVLSNHNNFHGENTSVERCIKSR